MAIALRRALISSRNLSVFLRTSSLHSPDHSHFASSPPCLYNSSPTHAAPNFPAINFNGDSRRGFAKGRKSKGDDDANTVEIVDIGPSVKATAVSLMEAAVDALSRELSKLRTGRASAGILDHIIVETGGVKMPLSRLAVVSVIDSKTLSVTPYDPNALKALESAIVSSPLGLNPKVDGQRLMAPVPPLTKEHMQALCKVVTKSSEDVKQSIRRARQKYNELSSTNQAANKYYKFSHLLKAEAATMALDTIKKAGSSFPKDAAKRLEKEVDDLTKKFIKSAEDMCKAKEKEIAAG